MVEKMVSANQALTREVDERRRMQLEREALLAREREASRLKDEFLAAVSHELRTPLHAIMGWTQVLAMRPPADEMFGRAVDSLLRNTEAQRRVIDDLLDVSRIITGKLDLTFGRVDLNAVAQSAIEMLQPSADAKGIGLTLRTLPMPCVVRADIHRLRQVMWNLLSNALKFTPAAGAIEVSITAGDAEYSIAVSDTGIGIAREFLPFVFDRFRQADGSTTREYGGLGLGLSIVKDLTELQGGRVAVSSAGPGRGARFVVTFPAASATTDRATQASENSSSKSLRLDGVDVIAADDNLDALDILTSVLARAGANVRVAASGRQALEQIRERPPHVVLCDLSMPEMDGFELLKGIRALDVGRPAPTPVLALTAHVSADFRERCRRAGFQDHVAKPIDVDRLIETVKSAAAAIAG
jgi:CheY-like chemotaxis protein